MTDDPSGEDPRLDEWEAERLVARYADGVTRRDWAGLVALFQPDAVLRLDLVDRPERTLNGPDEIVGFISPAVERFDFFEFVALNVLVTLSNDDRHGDDRHGDDRRGQPARTARTRTFMCEIRRHGPDDPDAGCWSTAFGLYQDRLVRTGAGWRFAERSYRSLARTGTVSTRDGVVFPFPDLPSRP